MIHGKKISNQTPQQILKHLSHLLTDDEKYDLHADPLKVHFEIKESTKHTRKKQTTKKKQRKEESKNLPKRKRRLQNTRKKTKPKIRTIKKGRTVPLKGVVY